MRRENEAGRVGDLGSDGSVEPVTIPRGTDLASLERAYREGKATPRDTVDASLEGIAGRAAEGIWIHLRDARELRDEALALEKKYPAAERPPLYGVPFAVKDSIDVAGVPTTVACPDFAYVPERSAPVVDALRAAGALFVGKVNLDQFATGLVGVRSPYYLESIDVTGFSFHSAPDVFHRGDEKAVHRQPDGGGAGSAGADREA